MLITIKQQQILVLLERIKAVSFKSQRAYNRRESFSKAVKELVMAGYVTESGLNGREKFYTLTSKGEVLAIWLR